jgi:hypothetical protein
MSSGFWQDCSADGVSHMTLIHRDRGYFALLWQVRLVIRNLCHSTRRVERAAPGQALH